jgi:hypothetical protein
MKFLFGLFLVLLSFSSVQAQEIAPTSRLLCNLKDARINESSGLAASQKYVDYNLLWTHNDSGGTPQVFLFNPDGDTVATVTLNGAQNRDWEDMAVAGGYIYVGDIGDNLRQHESVIIYRLPEPQLNPEGKNQNIQATPEKMTLKYPDAPCDSETLMATRNGELVLISKNGGASRFYKTPKPFENGSTQTLELVGEYAFTGPTAWSYLTTAGDLSPDGQRFVVRTYTHAHEWQLPGGDWKSALTKAPRSWELPKAKQGEAICYSADSMQYYVSSEGTPAPIWEIEFAPMTR